MTEIIFYGVFTVLIAIVFWGLCTRFKYNPTIEFGMCVQTGDYKLATVKLLEIWILTFLIGAGDKVFTTGDIRISDLCGRTD